MTTCGIQTMSRRGFLQQTAAVSGAALWTSAVPELPAQPARDWKKQIGIELYTVRDVLANDFEGVLAKLAEIGYKEIEPASGYNNMDPKSFRALLDRYGMTMPSTHSNYPAGTGVELEKQLEAQQVMGIKYTEIRSGAGSAGRGGSGPGRSLPPGAYYNPGTNTVRNSFTEMEVFGPYQPPVTLEASKKRAADLNANGRIAGKFGIKLFVHNHTGEFERLSDSDKTEFDILLAETDAELVTMQLDIGWVYVAGLDPLELFRKNPGRFELWHIKDVFGLKTVNPKLSPNERQSSLAFGPVGTGHIDYKKVFAGAGVAGLKHFVVEQDNAAVWGDSLAAARVSYQNLQMVI
ncbi:MAG TPA: sugar phosphate isomerase/epimerase [Bryobacteraceae bacterium]|nr:sugar phosphate isomerase/epimerase [Bryobacteraceae bacterium]